MQKNKPIIGITMGDPAGIGPEISIKSYIDPEVIGIKKIIIGNTKILKHIANLIGVKDLNFNSVEKAGDGEYNNEKIINIIDIPFDNFEDLVPGKVQSIAGDASFKYLIKGIDLALKGEIGAIATAPLNKEAIHMAGHNYPGHTEILAKYTGTKDYAMLLYDESLKVIHVSTHISLKKAIDSLSKERIYSVIKIADNTLKKLGYKKPRIAVAGLNPHAGEGGLFGDEEILIISPAIEKASAEGINVTGPVPPDTVFLKAKNGEFDIVVAMYHDQGHIPLKLLGFHTGVNVTAGLPIIRTSVDHGTAFGKAWKGKANHSSLTRAIQLAAHLAAKGSS